MSKLEGLRSKVEFIGLVLAVIGTAIYFYFGSVCNIMNAKIAVLLILSLALCAAGIFLRNNWIPVIAEIVLTIALMFIIQDCIATFVDWYNGTAMFGGTGRMDLVFPILGFIIVAIAVEIISCFMKDK